MSDAKRLREALGECLVGLEVLMGSDRQKRIDDIGHDLRCFLNEALEHAREAFIAPLQESTPRPLAAPPAQKGGEGCGVGTAGSIEEALKANAEVARTLHLCSAEFPEGAEAIDNVCGALGLRHYELADSLEDATCLRCLRIHIRALRGGYTPAELAHLKTLEGA